MRGQLGKGRCDYVEAVKAYSANIDAEYFCVVVASLRGVEAGVVDILNADIRIEAAGMVRVLDQALKMLLAGRIGNRALVDDAAIIARQLEIIAAAAQKHIPSYVLHIAIVVDWPRVKLPDDLLLDNYQL